MTFIIANRLAMTAAHTYVGTGVAQTSPAVFSADVFDGGRVTRAGAQITVTITHSAVEQVTLQLTAPSGPSKTWSAFAQGPAQPGTFRLAAPELAGAACAGRWTLAMTTTGQPATMIAWRLFVEGIGLGGLAADLFDWGIYLDPAHLGENGFTPDLPAAALAIARLQHAHTNGHLIRSLSAFPDSAVAVPDQFLPG